MSTTLKARRWHWRTTLPVLGILLVLAAGIALRFVYPADIEWKREERWTFDQSQQMRADGAWPSVGMPTSLGTPNPGMSLWVFAGLAALFKVDTPPELARTVASLNVMALLAFVIFGFAAFPKERREPWLWAAAMWAVNPVAVIFERKIWPPCVLPLGTVAFTAAWHFRHYTAAAFAWGLLGALMGQIHISAAFFALAVALWTLIYERGAFPWKGWIAGSVIGSLPALPWLFTAFGGGGASWRWRFPNFTYFLRWITQPFGFGIHYSLGGSMPDYLRGPLLDGQSTYLMALVYVAIALLLLLIAARAIRSALGERGVDPRSFLKTLFLGTDPETRLTNATLWGYGGIISFLTMLGPDTHRHYLIVVAPVLALWAVLLVMYGDRAPGRPRARVILTALCLGQAILSAGLLSYIDRTGVIAGDYGATWRVQQQGRTTPQ
jgi:hypothetical protein